MQTHHWITIAVNALLLGVAFGVFRQQVKNITERQDKMDRKIDNIYTKLDLMVTRVELTAVEERVGDRHREMADWNRELAQKQDKFEDNTNNRLNTHMIQITEGRTKCNANKERLDSVSAEVDSLRSGS
ncbi:MAG TPA: hypothetical protein DHN29_01575 [Cytophagales bacterium]|nr:hypothetical protein [Cytophagales bacterium]|tara:strand:+ start:2143 stop:2529 length:387 start_codon:yes stop_codon:yes gene_type:complete